MIGMLNALIIIIIIIMIMIIIIIKIIIMIIIIKIIIIVKRCLSRLLIISYYTKICNQKYTKIWEKISNLVGKEFDTEPGYGGNDKYIKTKIKPNGDQINANFQGKKLPKQNTPCKCLSLIMLDSIITVNKKYYPQALLEGCKYKIKRPKWRILLMMI